jgi:8-oxo-dGTP pyrophosphatase MutT (NUDIX family)
MENNNLVEGVRSRLVVQAIDWEIRARRLTFRQRLSPSLSYGRHFGPASPTSKPAAVMLRIEQRVLDGKEQWCVPLTVRDRGLPDHPGQISFPGGRVEPEESHLQAAEREFCEELSVADYSGQLLGQLSPIFVYNSDYYVQVFVSTGPAGEYSPEPREVERILFMPLNTLAAMHLVERSFFRQGVHSTAPGFQVGDDFIWGATAIILAEFAAVLNEL